MYHRFFGLDHDPFRLTPSAEAVFLHPSFERAKAYLEYGLMRAEGFVVVSGPPGSGKTTLVADLLNNLPRGTDVTQIVTSRLGADDLLRLTASNLGLTPAYRDKAAILDALHKELVKRSNLGRRALLVVDEAQDLEPEAIEELRLLTNLTRNHEPLLQILLLGQPELRDLIQRPEMEQFQQRLIASCRLQSLTEEQTGNYIRYRLERAHWRGDPAFSNAVLRLLHAATGGVPRRINLVAGRLLLDAFADARHRVMVADLAGVLDEMQDEPLDPVWRDRYDEIAAEEAREATPEPPAANDNSASVTDQDGATPTIEPTPQPYPEPHRSAAEPHEHETARQLGDDDNLSPLTEPPGDYRHAREPVLTDIVADNKTRSQPAAGSDITPRRTEQSRPTTPKRRHTTGVVATGVALVALVIVVAAATPAFDGLHHTVMSWIARVMAAP